MFSIKAQRVLDVHSGVHVEFLDRDGDDSAVVGMRVYADDARKVLHFRFQRNGGLISILEEEADDEGRVVARRTSAVALPAEHSLAVGDTIPVQRPGVPHAVEDRVELPVPFAEPLLLPPREDGETDDAYKERLAAWQDDVNRQREEWNARERERLAPKEAAQAEKEAEAEQVDERERNDPVLQRARPSFLRGETRGTQVPQR